MSRIVLFILMGLLQPGFALALEWQNLRSAVLELHPQKEDMLHIRWRHAWLSEANSEQLYLINARGELAEKLDIAAHEASGSHEMWLEPAQAPYWLVIPGYSFRNYDIGHGVHTASILEPERIHQTASLSRGQTLYFRIPAGRQARFAGKYHAGVDSIILTRQSDGYSQKLALQNKALYSAHDSVLLPVSQADELWSMTALASGKAAFWLEGVDNRFTSRAEHFPDANSVSGLASIRLLHEEAGRTPAIGVALPYLVPPVQALAPLERLNLQAASFYSFVDHINTGDGRELAFRNLYAGQMGINSSMTLLAGKNRRAVLRANRESLEGLRLWLQDTLKLPAGGIHYLAFADEPNLNFPDYEAFAEYFTAMLEYLKQQPGYAQSGVRVAVPASSRFLHGPFRPGAAQRLGIDWARQLLQQHGQDIDAIAWHEWMVRSPYATVIYRDSIRAAADLAGYDELGRPRKALLIDQTNISSGNSVSRHEQNTHFAALWWASVIIQSSRDGLLSMLNWFHVADEDDHQKGFFAVDKGQLVAKPVARAQSFLTQRWLSRVGKINNSSFEVDVLHAYEGQEQQLLGVNKSRRPYRLNVELGQDCPQTLDARVLGEDGNIRPLAFACADGQLGLELPAQGIFRLEWEM